MSSTHSETNNRNMVHSHNHLTSYRV